MNDAERERDRARENERGQAILNKVFDVNKKLTVLPMHGAFQMSGRNGATIMENCV